MVNRSSQIAAAGTVFLLTACTTFVSPGRAPVEDRSRPDVVVTPALPAPSTAPAPVAEAPPENTPEFISPAPTAALGASLALLQSARSERAAARYLQAERIIERALRIEPGNSELWLEMAEIRLAQGDFGQARLLAKKAQELGLPRPLQERANALLREAERSGRKA